MSVGGLTTIASNFPPKQTLDRLEAAVKAKGLTVFARIDHAAGAAAAGMVLAPTELLIFGNAKGGTPLMQADQTMGIDLPLKMLAWQDASGQSRLSYNQPEWQAERHGLGDAVRPVVEALAAALNGLARSAAEADRPAGQRPEAG